LISAIACSWLGIGFLPQEVRQRGNRKTAMKILDVLLLIPHLPKKI
jgi:hypothetical protein